MSDEDFKGNPKDLEAIRKGIYYWNEYVAAQRKAYVGWHANLQGANLQGANLQGADLQGAYLQEANLQEANLQGADLKGASLRGADLKRTILQGANLQRADLREADLQVANLQEANLLGASLQGAYLKGAYLQESNLQKADLRRANVTGAVLPKPPLDPELYQDVVFDDPADREHFLRFLRTQDINKKAPSADSKVTRDLEAIKYENLRRSVEEQAQSLDQLLGEAKAVSQELENVQLELEAASEELSKRVLMSHQQSADLETQNHNLETTISQVKELLDLETSMKANIEKTWKECGDRAEKRLEESSIPLLQAAKDEVRADAILEEAMESWTAKRTAHRNAYYAFSVIFAAAVIGLVIGAFFWHDNLVDLIVKNKAGDFTLGGVALITIPIIAIAWLLRFISRFALQNHSLMQDAHQRAITIITYAKLVGTPGAVEEKDRAIMLAAIFRPLPGAQDPDIAPPSLLDLVGSKDVFKVST